MMTQRTEYLLAEKVQKTIFFRLSILNITILFLKTQKIEKIVISCLQSTVMISFKFFSSSRQPTAFQSVLVTRASSSQHYEPDILDLLVELRLNHKASSLVTTGVLFYAAADVFRGAHDLCYTARKQQYFLLN